MHLLPWIVLGMAMCSTQALCPSCEVVVGPVRVQALSASLLRVERKGPKGTSSFLIYTGRWGGEPPLVDISTLL